MATGIEVVAVRRSSEDVLEHKILEPDPGLVKSLGAHHSLQSAVADLVDNSIDAGATRVLIRFEVDGGHPVALTVIDDGCGMNGLQADDAMRLGRQRDYASDSQGHFGIGLKAASFSHADTLSVWSTPNFRQYHGRRLRKSDVQRDYTCEVLDPQSFSTDLDTYLTLVEARIGTVVRWTDTLFPRRNDVDNDWIDAAKTNLRMHLGILYHRILSKRRMHIDLEVFDQDLSLAGAPESVVGIDPFDFSSTAAAGYPKTLTADVEGVPVRMRCHLVPPKSSGPQFRLYGRDGSDFQGFFIYRNDRLLQVGGWNDVIRAIPDRALARVAIDDYESLSALVGMNPEKSGITFSHELSLAVGLATSEEPSKADTVTFRDYIARAEAVLSESRRRKRARKPIVAPAKGLHEEVRKVIRSEVPIRKGEDPVEIRWRNLHPDKFLQLDRETRIIYLNQRYRQMLTGGRTGLSDAPLLKTLVFLLAEDHFTGQYWGARDKDMIDMWDSILGAAVRTEHEYRNTHGG